MEIKLVYRQLSLPHVPDMKNGYEPRTKLLQAQVQVSNLAERLGG
jgi:hypothetical protein